MKLISVTPSYGGSELARASIEFDSGIRMHNIKIMDHGVLARDASFTPDAVKQILSLVQGARLNDRIS